MQSSSSIPFSPSFNSYSSGTLADIAARVVQEFHSDSVSGDYDDLYTFKQQDDVYVDNLSNGVENRPNSQHGTKKGEKEGVDVENDDEFEFAFVCREPYSSPITADEIFYNGQIKPVFPLFNTNLLLEHGIDVVKKPQGRLTLRKLFIEERDSPSCSSSEADELDGAPPETYCVWRPKTPDQSQSPEICKKSNSTGNSSKRWKFRDLLHRSHSDGKDTFVILASKKRSEKVEKSGSLKVNENVKPNVQAGGVGEGVLTANKQKNRTSKKESERRRSYLPYKPDLVGIFTNVNGLSRNLHPF